MSCRSPPLDYITSSPASSPSKFSPPMMSMSDQNSFNAAAMRKLDRSFSDSIGDRPSKSSNINPSRYKTEMCRPFEESGHCKYGDKCQFAHGIHELRNLARHPKYKTDLCRTFHTIGFCPYGPRCHFIHNEDERKLNYIIQQKHQQAVQQASQQVAQQAAQLQQLHLSSQPPIQRPKLMMSMPPPGFTRDHLGSTADSPPDSITSESPQSLSPTSGLGDHDVFSPCSSLGSTALTPPPMFSYPQEFSSSSLNMQVGTSPTPIMTPLNVNIDNFHASLALVNHDNFASLALLQAAVQQQLQQQQQLRDNSNTDMFYTPPSPPDSVNGDEVESFLQRSLRLPFFSQLSED